MKSTVKSSDIVNRIGQLMHEGMFNNKELVQLIELSGMYLNIKSISDYAKENNMSYNGVKHHRQIVTLFNNKYVIDNN